MDQLQQSLSKLTVSNKKLLFIDALNYGYRILTTNKFNNWRSSSEILNFIKRFVNALKSSGWEIQVFIDGSTATDETEQKWIQRREKEVIRCEKHLPHGNSKLIGAAFEKCGIKVHYSHEADNDDTIFSHAYHYGASILSGDKDMLRYVDQNGKKIKLKIFTDFHLDGKYITLIPRNSTRPARLPSPRSLISPPPTTTNILGSFNNITKYERGTPSPLTKHLGNLHVTIRPLRQALYARNKTIGPVLEVFPIWDDQNDKVIWTNDLVMPDSTLDHLLDDVNVAYAHFFADVKSKSKEFPEILWKKHIHACKAVILELVCEATGQCLLDLCEKL